MQKRWYLMDMAFYSQNLRKLIDCDQPTKALTTNELVPARPLEVRLPGPFTLGECGL